MAAGARFHASALVLLLFLAQKFSINPASAQCTGNNLLSGFSNCEDLQPSTFAWTYFEENSTASIAYSDTALSTSGWVGWGINFNGTSMVNSNALIAFNEPNGSSSVLRYKLTSAVYDDSSVPLNPVSSFDLEVLNMSTVISGTSFTIFATIQLPTGLTSVNQVYNRGPSVSNDIPAPHGTGQLNGMRTIDLTTGSITASEAPHQKLKNIHGTLAAVSWGVILILGAMVSRYLRHFSFADPAWFYMHVFLQTSAYVLGVAAWAIGLRLGTLSPGVVYHAHRNVGISVFTLATVQMFALCMRPDKEHKFRMYWNIYHHGLGYTVIILGVINIFKGFNILQPAIKYKIVYISFLVLAACVSLGLEAAMWINFLNKRKEKKRQGSQQPDGYAMNGNGTSTINGSGAGSQSPAAARPKSDSEV